LRVPWPLVGRAEELAAIVRALAGGQSVVLAGTAGVGKSRLAREACSQLGDAGAQRARRGPRRRGRPRPATDLPRCRPDSTCVESLTPLARRCGLAVEPAEVLRAGTDPAVVVG
jgi:hypothetical protein